MIYIYIYPLPIFFIKCCVGKILQAAGDKDIDEASVLAMLEEQKKVYSNKMRDVWQFTCKIMLLTSVILGFFNAFYYLFTTYIY